MDGRNRINFNARLSGIAKDKRMGDLFRDELKELDIEAQVDNIWGIRIVNIAKGFNHWTEGPYPNRCCFYFEMRIIPKFEVYHFIDGKYLVSYDKNTGAVNCYEYERGSTRGFAGAEITLPIYGLGKVFKNKGTTKMTFKGSLWNTGEAYRAAANFFNTDLHSIAYTKWGDNGCGISVLIDRKVFNMKLKMAGIAMQGPSYSDERNVAA